MVTKRNIFKGLGIALVTPFNEDGTVDYQSLEKLLHYQLDNGADFLCILATTGETPCLTADEKSRIKKQYYGQTIKVRVFIFRMPISRNIQTRQHLIFRASVSVMATRLCLS